MVQLEIPADTLDNLTDCRITLILANATEPQAIAFVAIIREFRTQIDQHCDSEKVQRMLNGDPENEFLRFEMNPADLKLFSEIVEDLTEPPAKSATGDRMSNVDALKQLRSIAQAWADLDTWLED